MAMVYLQGTKFTFSVLPLKLFSKGYWARTEISIHNEYVKYAEIGENLSREELEEWIFASFRLLAGAYGQEYNLSFERAGLAIDLYPYTENGNAVSREKRRQNDCVMVIRLLMRSSHKKRLLGGVYSVLLHREDIEKFVTSLREEFDAAFAKFERKKGKYLFVGVSPKGYTGCNYQYVDPTKTVQKGDFVWVQMGKHNTEQIAYVDNVKYYDDDTVPYVPKRARHVLRKALPEECNETISFDE